MGPKPQPFLYDVSNAKILSYSPTELYCQQVSNHTSLPQTSTISGSDEFLKCPVGPTTKPHLSSSV